MRRSTTPPSERSRQQWKRLGAGAVGAALLVIGLRRRSFAGAAAALVGGWLTYRAVHGGTTAEKTDHRRRRSADVDGMSVERSITIGAPARDLSAYFRDATQLDRIMGEAVEVTEVGDDSHRWTVEAPGGRELSWKTRIVEDRPGERLRWTAVDGSWLALDGTVAFGDAPGDRGTEVTLELRAHPPGGRVGTAVLERAGIVPASLVGKALDRLKSLVETGEIQTLERNPSARGRGDRM